MYACHLSIAMPIGICNRMPMCAIFFSRERNSNRRLLELESSRVRGTYLGSVVWPTWPVAPWATWCECVRKPERKRMRNPKHALTPPLGGRSALEWSRVLGLAHLLYGYKAVLR